MSSTEGRGQESEGKKKGGGTHAVDCSSHNISAGKCFVVRARSQTPHPKHPEKNEERKTRTQFWILNLARSSKN